MASERELSIAFFVTAESSFLGALWKIERLEEQMMAKNQAAAASDKRKKREQFKGHFLSLLHNSEVNNKIIRLIFPFCKICYNLPESTVIKLAGNSNARIAANSIS